MLVVVSRLAGVLEQEGQAVHDLQVELIWQGQPPRANNKMAQERACRGKQAVARRTSDY